MHPSARKDKQAGRKGAHPSAVPTPGLLACPGGASAFPSPASPLPPRDQQPVPKTLTSQRGRRSSVGGIMVILDYACRRRRSQTDGN